MLKDIDSKLDYLARSKWQLYFSSYLSSGRW
jgi:hypothetical protein